MYKLKVLFSILAVMSLSSCSLLDNERPEVFFINLSDPKVKLPFNNTNDTHKITEVWAFADGQILGIFPLPAKIPVNVTDMETEITILAGIRNNGMLDQPVFYPFYKSINKVIKGKPGESFTFPLEFSYVDNTKFSVNESFEGSHCFTADLDGKAKPELSITSENATIGTRSAMIRLTSSENYLEVACNQLVKKGDNARGKSYLELDYKGEGEIAVGVLKINTTVPRTIYSLFIPAKDNWNKIYVEFTDLVSQNDYNEYSVILSVRKTSISAESKVYLDNIKHVHF